MRRFEDLRRFFLLPRASINLMFEKTIGNDPFYARVVEDFYEETRRRHPKLLFARKYEHGFALCNLPGAFEAYFMSIEDSACRNYRKAVRLGYEAARFDYNARLEDIREIWLSTPVRQGELPGEIREGRVHPISNPPSLNPCHDYPYFGVFKNGKLLAYAGCSVMGEVCNLNELYGHAHHQNDGLVPMLIVEIARKLFEFHPHVKYYGYGTYFGATESMRRFKRKFLFYPHHVDWILG